ncbi:chitin binding domain-containing protein [Plectonema radiosum NIES-515]|uniref:Chitin binding domain-containing protein n=1 Tax=Plectonema radiosum NIES-515 TaxID=2986073 RepID=A0ABT3ASA9_9CYAN|nr:chitin binding peritrophin-A domain-containing protein [Plectonema radiosum]MCV3212002.1 chitin binding domain-containing protein [Plectonema radiosum NIES-515]
MKKLLGCCLAVILAMWVAISPAIAQKITCTQEGFFGNPTDCSKFYRCVDYSQTKENFTIFRL